MRGARYVDAVAHAYVAALLKGKWAYVKDLLDREEGPPGTSPAGSNSKVHVVYRVNTGSKGNWPCTSDCGTREENADATRRGRPAAP